MVTTIQITERLKEELSSLKLFSNETYEEVIWDLIEDTKELHEETRRQLEKGRAEIRAGNVYYS